MKYYAVYGTNGLGVYNDADKLNDAAEYIKKRHIKKYNKKEKAIEEAIFQYNLLVGADYMPNGYYNDNDMRMNWLYYRKDLCK